MGPLLLITVLLHAFVSFWQLRKQPKGRIRRAYSFKGKIISVAITLKECEIMPAIILSLVTYSFHPHWKAWLIIDLMSILWLQAVGVVLILISIAIKVRAYIVLGNNWSARPTIYEDHSLIREGPYAWVRHPVYTSNLLMLLGTFLTTGSATLLALGIWYFSTDVIRANAEEKLLSHSFGTIYAKYKARVGKFVPVAVSLSCVGIIVVCNLIGIGDEFLFTISGNSPLVSVLEHLLGK